MKEDDSDLGDILTINKVDSVKSNNQSNTKESHEEFVKFIKTSNTKKLLDIQSLTEELKNLHCCINKFLLQILNEPKGLSLLIEIRRKKNLTIKMYEIYNSETDIIYFCQWCKENCLKFQHSTEKEINLVETNSKICGCEIDDHDIFKYKSKLKLSSEEKKEIDKIIDLCNDITIEDKNNVIKEQILNLINGKDNIKILQLISYMLKINEINSIFWGFNYDDEIYSKVLSCLIESKDISSFTNIMDFYMLTYFNQKFSYLEAPVFAFNEGNIYIDFTPSVYYYNPDIFAQSFYFEVYRKNIVLKSIEYYDIISYLRKLGFTNDILCSYVLNSINMPQQIFSFGFFSLDTITSKLNQKELTQFKRYINRNILYILKNQSCDIFSDFMNYGKTDRISLIDKSNYLSKSFLENIFDSSSNLYDSKLYYFLIIQYKNSLIYYPLFKYLFFDENKQRILTVLSSYSFSRAKISNIFNDSDDFKEIFNMIEEKVKNIVTEKILRKKNDSEQNIFIVNKLLNLYKLKNDNIDELYLYDFNNLIQNIIDKDYPIKLTEKAIKILDEYIKDFKTLNIYLDYIIKITILCCTNIVGGSYIYNSNFIPKIIKIISQLDFNDYFNFILEMLIILKVVFNRQIIDISFLRGINKSKTDQINMTVKEYLIDILFRTEPIISNESMYDFDIFERLLNRVNFIFDKINLNKIPDSFNDINCEESYLNIVKIFALKMKEEFSLMEWKIEKNYSASFNVLKNEEFIKENENFIEKKINEEIIKSQTKISNLILLELIRCLENLNQTNFYLNYNEKSFFIDNNYDLVSIIKNEKLPFAIKSIILNYLLKLVLSFKIDNSNNKIYGPLILITNFDKSAYEYKIKGKYLLTLESEESEKHLSETVKLINIFIMCIDLLKKKKKSLDFKKAYIEKNGLYDFCVSIIHAIYYFSNLIVNTNYIHELYISSFLNLAIMFFEIENIFMKIINNKFEHNQIIIQDNNDFEYQKKISVVVEINNILENYIDKINSDSYNFSYKKISSIYQSFINFHNGQLSSSSANHYSFILQHKEIEEIKIDELNEFNGLNSDINSKVLENYNNWKNYVNNEVYNIKESFRVKNIVEKILNLKTKGISKRETFYSYLFYNIADLKSTGDSILSDSLFLKGLIRLIRGDDLFKSVCEDGKIKKIISDYFKILNIDFDEFKARIIGKIIRKIYFLTNYELLISKCFSNTKQENYLTELLNCIILFLELLGENFNQFFHDAIFKYKFDFSKEKDNIPVAKYDDESKKFNMLIENYEGNNIYTPYEMLLNLHQKIFESLNINCDDTYRETKQNNLLIIFNSLTYCIIEFSNYDNPDYKIIMEELFSKYFFWKKEDGTFNPIFKTINFEIDDNLIDKTKKIFILNNLLYIFVFYIKYGIKDITDNFFFKLCLYPSFNPKIYIFHVFIYTSQIINYFDKELLNKKNSLENIIELYKQRKFNSIQLFQIAKKYYELIYLLKNDFGYFEFYSVLPKYDTKHINSNKIIEEFTDSQIYSNLIYKIIITDNTLNDFEKLSKFRDFSKPMDIIFNFWKKIFFEIEICLDDKKQNIYYFLRPEILYLSQDEKIYYEDNIDRSSRDSKLISFYENIDSFIFEMVYNVNHKRYNLAKLVQYFGLELINIIFFIIDNIILIIHYYKSWKKDYSIYNEIDNNKSSLVLLILSGVHILYIIIVIINWFVNRLKIEYYYALTKYSIKEFKTKSQFSLRVKADKIKKLLTNYSSSISTIKDHFPQIKDTNKKNIILIFDTIILNPKVFPFLISLICLILYFVFSSIFLVIPLTLIANLIPTLSAIFKGLFYKFKYLIFIYTYTLIVLYIFSWVGFLFLPHLFKFEVVNKNNEFIVDENQENIEESVCSSSIQCILYFLNFGLSSGGALDLNLISFKNTYGHYLRQFFFNMFLFLFINMIFSNIFLALITDAFGEMREKAWDNENDKNNVCFICDLNRADCINKNIDFKNHIKDHSKWKYINFMCKLLLEDDVEFNKEEYYIWELMKKKNIDWFPAKPKDE